MPARISIDAARHSGADKEEGEKVFARNTNPQRQRTVGRAWHHGFRIFAQRVQSKGSDKSGLSLRRVNANKIGLINASPIGRGPTPDVREYDISLERFQHAFVTTK